MSWLERVVDRLLVAYLGAVLTLALLPVFAFMLALALADWIDTKCLDRFTTSTDENGSSPF